MNTTNLIADYLIAGLVGILTIIVPYLLINPSYLYLILDNLKENNSIIIVLGLVIYTFGILYNQLSDIIENKFFKFFKNNFIQINEEKVKEKTNLDHHFALQFIVVNSESAYNYLSFRRTMVRILRTLLVSFCIFIFLHLIYSMFIHIFIHKLIFSIFNFLLIISILPLAFLTSKIVEKLYTGYYAAIINFVKVIETNKNHEIKN